MSPVVQLCTALVVESGLTTPTPELVFDPRFLPQCSTTVDWLGRSKSTADPAARSGTVCGELEIQCPSIFAQVDLRYVQVRLGRTGASGTGAGNELLHRYAQCVGAGALKDHWALLARSVRAQALEDPAAATDICIQKLQQLQQARKDGAWEEEQVAFQEKAKLLVDALLSAVAECRRMRTMNDRSLAVRELLEHLLAKTASIRFTGDFDLMDGVLLNNDQTTVSFGGKATNLPSTPPVHAAIFEHLLESPRLRCQLEALIGTPVADVLGFLTQRCRTHRLAGDILWKHYMQQGKPAVASEVLVQLSQITDEECTLQDRVRYLDLAKKTASQVTPSTPSKVVENLTHQLEIAALVQVPLFQELQLIVDDERLGERWREAAQKQRHELRKLVGLEALYRAAKDFGLFHIMLVATDLSAGLQEQKPPSADWVSAFFPPMLSAYSPSEMTTPPSLRVHGVFPLFTVRRGVTFFAGVDEAPRLLPKVSQASATDFQVRAMRFVDELASTTQTKGALLDPRLVCTLLEYCTCLWFRAFEVTEETDVAVAHTPETAFQPSTQDNIAAKSESIPPAGLESVQSHGVVVHNHPMPSSGPPTLFVGAGLRTPSASTPHGATPDTLLRRTPATLPAHVQTASRVPASPRDVNRAWVALELMPRRPFHFSPARVLRFYDDLLGGFSAWLPDLRALIPDTVENRVPTIKDDDVQVHLASVILTLLDQWMLALENGASRDKVEEFEGAWPIAEKTLSELEKWLSSVRVGLQSRGKNLLQDIRRVRSDGQHRCKKEDNLRDHNLLAPIHRS